MRSNQWLIDIWSKEYAQAKKLDSIPSMLYYSYDQLMELIKDGQVYGALLQIKDVFEQLYKIPIVMALIILDTESQYKDKKEYSDIIKAAIGSPMSMGQWDALASTIIKSSKSITLPETIINILKRTRSLYRTEISPTVPDIINWRNNTIGHGVLKFEDDPLYREEINNLLEMLREYFYGEGKYSITNLYDNAYFIQGDYKLIGSTLYSCDYNSVLKLYVDNKEYECIHYTNNRELKYYLFDSYYSKKQVIKYCSYYDGQNEIIQSKYFSDLYAKHILKRIPNNSIFSDVISREDDVLLEFLNAPLEYVKPLELIQCLEDKLEEMNNGVITIFMERGTGKSAFANQMSGLYHSSSLIKNSFSRCYHISNASIRGSIDFINAINFNFRHSYDPSQDLWGTMDDIPTLTLKTSTPSLDMANFLNYYHEKYRKDYTILLIDGIDEITDQNNLIIDYIPDKNNLNDGVFVVLLSRFKDEKTVIGLSKRNIERIEPLSNYCIYVHRQSHMNTNVLRRMLERNNKDTKSTIVNFDEIIRKADYRYLYLKAIIDIKDDWVLDTSTERLFIQGYLNHILSYYGPIQRRRLRELTVAIALFPGITIKQYQEYLNYIKLSYEFIGMLNDIMPLLTVIHNSGESSYEFADSAYVEYILDEYANELTSIVKSFEFSFENHLHGYITEIPPYRYFYLKEKNPLEAKRMETELDNDILFFAEGYIGIYNLSLKSKKLMQLSSNSINVARLCCAMRYDLPWVKNGYPHFLYMEMLECICYRLDYALRNTDIPELVVWLKEINSNLSATSKDFGDSIRFLKRDMTSNKYIEGIYNNILKGIFIVDSIEEWFWLFESKISEETLNFIVEKNHLKEFLYHLNEIDVINAYPTWIDLLLNYVENNPVSSDEEEIVLNLVIKNYIKCPFKNTSDPERNAIMASSILYKRNHSINNVILGDEVNDYILKKIINRTLFLEDFEREKKNALGILQDYQKQWKVDQDGFGQLFNVFSCLENSYLTNSVNKEAVGELYDAIYERMCFERDSGDLYFFICAEDHIGERFIDILKRRFQNDEYVYLELKKWISGLWKNVLSRADNEKYNGLRFLAKVFEYAIKWLDSKNKTVEALELLEFYIYNIDTRKYVEEIPHYIGSKNYNEYRRAIIWDEKKFVFCTDNTLHLLKRYFDNNMTEEMFSLMTIIDKSIYVIYSSSFFNETGKWEEEYDIPIQIFKYLSFRSLINFRSDINDFINNMLNKKEKEISSILENDNKNVAFRRVEYDINYLMEYVWRTAQWGLGETICNRLLSSVIPKEMDSGRKLDETICQERTLIKVYRAFIRFLMGKHFDNRLFNEFHYVPSPTLTLKSDSMISAIYRYKRAKGKQDPSNYIVKNNYLFGTYNYLEDNGYLGFFFL